MAFEILSIPESKLEEVIKVIKLGIETAKEQPDISQETIDMLIRWCNEETEYLENLQKDNAIEG